MQGHLTEFRSTGQYSRYNLKITGKYGANNVVGYIEGDFNGNDAANVFVTSNTHTNRLRLYWLDLKRGKWEFLGGQILGPGNAEPQWPFAQAGRPGFDPRRRCQRSRGHSLHSRRLSSAPYTTSVTISSGAFALQNPQQFVGAGEVIFPFAFNAAIGPAV